MKTLKRILAVLMSLTSVMSLVACGGGATPEDPNKGDKNRTKTLSVSIFNGGYGMGWLYELKRGFEDIHKDVYIEITPSYSDSNARTELMSGVSQNDLYFLKDHYFGYVDSGNVRVGGTTYESYYADLSDVMNGPAYGETETIASKFTTEKIEWLTSSKGKIHAIPWGGNMFGFACNLDILAQVDCEVPVTTDEMFDCFEKIKAANLTNTYGQQVFPLNLTTSADNSLRQPQVTWFAQYNGTEGWDNFWNGIDENGEYLQPSLLNNKGLLRSLEVAEKMGNANNKYLHKYCLTDDFVTQQFRVFNKECAFLLTGDWVLNETASNFTEEELKDTIFVKYPLISSIVEKLNDKDMTDETLATIVREIDAGATSSTLCSDTDFAIIKDARSINLDGSNIHLAVVPCYSDNIELAKEFLRYVYTDNGFKIFANNTRGNIWITNYDYEANGVQFNNFAKSAYDVMRTSTNLNFYNSKHPLFSRNGLYYMNGDWNNFPIYFETTSDVDRKTAKEMFEGNLLYVTQRWDTYSANLG